MDSCAEKVVNQRGIFICYNRGISSYNTIFSTIYAIPHCMIYALWHTKGVETFKVMFIMESSEVSLFFLVKEPSTSDLAVYLLYGILPIYRSP